MTKGNSYEVKLNKEIFIHHFLTAALWKLHVVYTFNFQTTELQRGWFKGICRILREHKEKSLSVHSGEFKPNIETIKISQSSFIWVKYRYEKGIIV